MTPAAPLRDALRQLAGVIRDLDDAQYTRPPRNGFTGSVGAHVRHCLDHVEALLGAAVTGSLDYDDRKRGSPIETDRMRALAAIGRMETELTSLAADAMRRPVTVASLISPDLPPARLESSLGRELAYVISHTTHHNALIGCLVAAMGRPVPDRFGYAAATLAWMDRTRCAP